MSTMGEICDAVQRLLQDAPSLGEDGVIWRRSELLEWANAGYRQLLSTGMGVRRWTVLEVPPRWSYTMTQGWEARYTSGGTHLLWTHQTTGGYACSTLWEIEQLEGEAPTASAWGIAQSWERAYVSADHTPFRFALPRDNNRIVKLWHDHDLLHPLATRDLDELETAWMSLEGEPLCWVLGTGRNRTVEIFAVSTADQQSYQQLQNPQGIPRRFSGSRTYEAVEASGYNAWAYTTDGDRQLFTAAPDLRRWTTAVCFAWELDYVHRPGLGLQWAVADVPGLPDLSYVASQAWEMAHAHGMSVSTAGTSGGVRGMFAFERRDRASQWGPFTVPTTQPSLILAGSALRLTQDAESETHGVQAWEAAMLAGDTLEGSTGPIGCYQWESDYGAGPAGLLPFGMPRALRSPERQYLVREEPTVQTPLGRPLQFLSSDDNLLLLEQVGPEIPALGQSDTPLLLPTPLHKYIRFYVLARAYAREGEGQQPALAQVYQQRVSGCVAFLQRLGQMLRADVAAVRRPRAAGGRPARPRLPSHYPRVR